MTACRPSDGAAERYISECATLLAELSSSSQSLAGGVVEFSALVSAPMVAAVSGLNDGLDLVSGHELDAETARQVPEGMIGRLLDDKPCASCNGLSHPRSAGPLCAAPDSHAQRGQAMTLRKGEISQAQLRREWPRHVTLCAEKVRGLKNSEVTRGFAHTLSVAPRTYALRCGDLDYVVFCFAKPEGADDGDEPER
jgi:hypothetical protein